jgi:hypothetical protein
MALRWATASAEVNRKPDEGVTGSVHFFRVRIEIRVR